MFWRKSATKQSYEDEELAFERGFNYPFKDIPGGHFEDVDSEADALDIFRKHPEADMYVYQVGAGDLWLKKAAAFVNRVREDHCVAAFRMGRGGKDFQAFV